MTFRPSKWVLYAPVAILPLLAAWVLNGNSVQEDLAVRSAAALKAAGAGWAKLSVSGRDATLSGEAPSADAIAEATKAVAGTYGVRRVEEIARIVK